MRRLRAILATVLAAATVTTGSVVTAPAAHTS